MTVAGYPLDTNVISESIEARPVVQVARWLDEVDEDRAFLGVAAVAELRFGVERRPRSRRREELAAWLVRELLDRFEGRLLGVNRLIADARGVVPAPSRRAGVNIGVIDALLAATAPAHQPSLATRTTRYVGGLNVSLPNP